MNMTTQLTTITVIDEEELLKRCMGNKPFAARILIAFQNQLTSDLDELDNAIESEDYDRISAIAHRIKGSSSNVSALRLNQVAAALEDFSKGRNSDIQDLRSFQEHIRNEQVSLVEITTNLFPKE